MPTRSAGPALHPAPRAFLLLPRREGVRRTLLPHADTDRKTALSLPAVKLRGPARAAAPPPACQN